jgi:uncharacterized protein YbjT (DUF2867 family)
MRILLTGANGFLGRYILAALQAAGHVVVPAVRHAGTLDGAINADFNRDVTPDIWLPRLRGIDAVVNCAGVLAGGRGQSIAAIHTDAPVALFEACRRAGVRRVVQISAVSVGADTSYARTKRAADDALAAMDLDWVILRPSLVYAQGAYGGTALFRALAALPFAVPLIGKGDQVFQPIHVDDLTASVLWALDASAEQVVEPVGPEEIDLRRILIDLRRWLGFDAVPTIAVPLWLIGFIARIGDIAGGPVNTTALRQIAYGNAAPVAPFIAATGIHPRRWRDALAAGPAQVADRWQARLYFVRPLLRLALASTWILSGVAGLVHRGDLNFAAFGISLSPLAIWLTCMLDMAIGAAVLLRWRTGTIALVQLVIVLGYSLALTFAAPSLWLAPLGPLLKNLPFVVAVLALAVLERER